MPLWVKTILKYILYFEKFYGIIKVRKKYIDNICPPKPFRAIKKIHFIFYVCMEKVGEGYGGERSLW